MHVVELDRQIVLVRYYWYIILLSMMERLSLRDEISESLGKKLDTSIIRVDAVDGILLFITNRLTMCTRCF